MMMHAPIDALAPAGPERRRGVELEREVLLANGEVAVFSRLLPELTKDAMVRRRYLREVESLARACPTSVARILDFGPKPEAHARVVAEPWRLRERVSGTSLETWLAAGPHDEAEVRQVGAELAEAFAQVHDAGLLVRDFDPRELLRTSDGRWRFADLRLSRVIGLWTLTRRSLQLEVSPYTAPEAELEVRIDSRADIYTLGTVLRRALTGVVPRPRASLDRASQPARVQPEPPGSNTLTSLIDACLSSSPAGRPATARELAQDLRTRRGAHERARMPCQTCGASIDALLSLCPECGHEAVCFPRSEGEDARWSVVLCSLEPTADNIKKLRDFLNQVAQEPPSSLNFRLSLLEMGGMGHGPQGTHGLPAALFTHLSRATADVLCLRLRALGLDAEVRTNPWSTPARLIPWVVFWVVVVWGAQLTLGFSTAMRGALLVWLLAMVASVYTRRVLHQTSPFGTPGNLKLKLRPTPIALPPAEPVVRRISALLRERLRPDVKREIARLMILLQVVVEERAKATDTERAAGAEASKTIERLLDVLEKQAHALRDLDDDLDRSRYAETAIVAAWMKSEARDEPADARATLLSDLDRLRELEDHRGRIFQALLTTASLLRRAADLVRASAAESNEYEHLLTAARATLEVDLTTALPARSDPS